MNDIKEYSVEELEAELENRKVIPFPGMYVEDDIKLRELLRGYIDYCVSPEYHEDNDWMHYIYECVLETYYSKEIWNWFKEVRK